MFGLLWAVSNTNLDATESWPKIWIWNLTFKFLYYLNITLVSNVVIIIMALKLVNTLFIHKIIIKVELNKPFINIESRMKECN